MLTHQDLLISTATSYLSVAQATDQVADHCFTAASTNGWHNDFPDRRDYRNEGAWKQAVTLWVVAKLGLIAGEAHEAVEEIRNGRELTATYYRDERPGSGTHGQEFDEQLLIDGVPQYKPEGVTAEVADIIIRAGDLSGFLSLNLGPILEEKLIYNATRGQRHGGKAL